MSGIYGAVARAASRVVGQLGAPVTFTKSKTATDPATGASSVQVSSVSGDAIQVTGQPRAYERLGLVPSEATTLMFTPDTPGELPELDAVCEWAGVKQTVKEVQPVAPAGTALAAYVVIAR